MIHEEYPHTKLNHEEPGYFTLFIEMLPFWLLILMPGLARAAEDEIKITYVSADLVFLDHGKNANLTAGDLLRVVNADLQARLRVARVAAKSASATIVSQSGSLVVGSPVVVIEKAETKQVSSPQTSKRSRSVQPSRKVAEKRRNRSGISGTVSLQNYLYRDATQSGGDFNQPGIRLNLRGRELFGGGYSFRVKTRTRYTQRDPSSSSNIPETELKNRIYEASFGFEKKDARISYRLGRVISDKFGAVGFIDGGLLDVALGKHTKVGVFAGTQPQWQSAETETSLTKYGAYIHYKRGSYQTRLWESTLALAGEYHGSTVSREFAYLRNRISLNQRFTLFQSAELEINRDWRKERTGKSLDLSNLHLYGRFRLSKKIDIGLTYDDRQNYYTYERRNRDEAYFNQFSRQGTRADLRVKFSDSLNFNANYGNRLTKGGLEETQYYYANLYKRSFLLKNLSINMKVNSFENKLVRGVNPSLRLGKRFGQAGNTVYLSYATYDYTFFNTNTQRHTEWVRLESYFSLGRRWLLTSQYEYNMGDDAEGHRLYLEIGYRF